MTPGKFILAVPSNDTPPRVLAVSSAVAVEALPVTSPVTVAVRTPVTVAPAAVVSNFLELLLYNITAPLSLHTIDCSPD